MHVAIWSIPSRGVFVLKNNNFTPGHKAEECWEPGGVHVLEQTFTPGHRAVECWEPGGVLVAIKNKTSLQEIEQRG